MSWRRFALGVLVGAVGAAYLRCWYRRFDPENPHQQAREQAYLEGES